MAAELAKTSGPTPDTVIPAQAGIQGIGMKYCPVFLDSRLRGNDGREGTLLLAGMTEAGVAVRAEPAWIPACAGMTVGKGLFC